MPFTTAETNNILNWMMGKGTISSKSEIYIGLLTNDPEADNGTCTEITQGFDTYERVLISRGNNQFPYLMGNAENRVITNIAQINWTKATQDWPEVKGIALYTAKTGGTPFYYSKVPTPFTTETGAVALFEAGNFKVAMLGTDVSIT